jgi:hypothetical protein
MTFRHQELAAGRWFQFSLAEQLANVGSEVSRALTWQHRGNAEHCRMAVERALELLDLTLMDTRLRGRLREIARVREVLADYFYADNCYGSSPANLRRYFDAFALAARANR